MCLPPEALRAEPVGNAAIWARYRHWAICDYDARKAERYLDVLVMSEDPAALQFRAEELRTSDPSGAARLHARAVELGWRPRTREGGLEELAQQP